MIYTLTFNPCIDYLMWAQDFKEGSINRSEEELIFFGGKGINVSLVLSRLGIKNTALGFAAGFTGDALVSWLKKEGIRTDFIKLKDGYTRINVKLKTDKETEINGIGPNIPDSSLEKLYKKLNKLKRDDILIISGSVPKTLSSDVYSKILERLSKKGVTFVIDATKDLLIKTLKYKPLLIKPNIYELEEIFDKKFSDETDIVEAALKLKEMGALNVLVSLGENGAILVDENRFTKKCEPIKIEAINTTGAGDSMVAGFLAGLVNGYDYALKLGNACGAATAASLGIASKESILKLFEN